MKTLFAALFLCATTFAQTKTCQKGEYLTFDGQCLHDQTGESSPVGDGCNTMTCMDPACHMSSRTAMMCLHWDDPASPPPTVVLSPTPIWTPPQYPKMWCGQRLIGFLLQKVDGKIYECAAKPKKVKKP